MRKLIAAILLTLAALGGTYAALSWRSRPAGPPCVSAARSQLPITSALQEYHCNGAVRRNGAAAAAQ